MSDPDKLDVTALIDAAGKHSAALLSALSQLMAALPADSKALAHAERWHKAATAMYPSFLGSTTVAINEDNRPKGRPVRLERRDRWIDTVTRTTAELVRKTPTRAILLVGEFPHAQEQMYRLSDGKVHPKKPYGNWWRICDEDLEMLRELAK